MRFLSLVLVLFWGADTAFAAFLKGDRSQRHAMKRPSVSAESPSVSPRPAKTYRKADRSRPRPTVVAPPVCGEGELAGKPPSDAVVLFDGREFLGFVNFNPRDLTNEGPAKWKVGNGVAMASGGQLQTREKFADCHFHMEWRTSAEEATRADRFDQKRGNSGVEFGDHPEIQILDSFENDTYPDGQAAAIYGYWPPLVNAMRAPGEWQVFDVFYTAPVFDEGKKVKAATYTVIHNGLPVHLMAEVAGEETECRIRLRPHGGLIQYRNIWVRPLHCYDENEGKPLPAGARTENPFAKPKK